MRGVFSAQRRRDKAYGYQVSALCLMNFIAEFIGMCPSGGMHDT